MMNWLTYGVVDLASYTQSFIVFSAFVLWYFSVKRHISIREHWKLLAKMSLITFAGAIMTPFLILLIRGKMMLFISGTWRALSSVKNFHDVWLFMLAAYHGVSITAGLFLLVLIIRLMPSTRPIRFAVLHPFNLFAAVARLGCFAKGCCFGKKINPDSFLATIYPPGSPASAFFKRTGELMSRFQPSLPVHPTQIYIFLSLMVLFGVQSWLWKKRLASERMIILIAISGYAVINFLIEFLRQERIVLGGLTMGQVLEIGLLFLAVSLYRSSNTKTEEKE